MDNKELELNDIAQQLLIINQITIDKLFSLDNGAECVALYIFYYKTAKWQNTSAVKANDEYCMKCLKWGKDRLNRAKKVLKENGLIDIIQRRKDNKITGWYVKVNYFLNPRSTISYKYQNLLVGNKTQMLINNNINTINNNINALEHENKCKREKYFDNEEVNNLFLDFLKMRTKMKAINSERAINNLLNTLNKHDDKTKIQMINNSITNSWKGIFEIKPKEQPKNDTFSIEGRRIFDDEYFKTH